jgi:gliding motility-associated-like protein
LWQFGNGDTSHQQNPSYTYTTANTYTVSVTATNEFGCADTAQGTLTANPLPATDAGPDTAICAGQSIVLQPSGANTYVWQASTSLSCTNCTNPTAKPDSTTRYYVTGTSGAGCVASDSVQVTVNQPFTLTVATSDTLCAGFSIQLSASGAQQYTWQPSTGLSDPNIANPVASPASTTTYTLVATDGKSCFADTATVVVNVFANPTVNLVDSVVTIIAGSNYLPTSVTSPDVVAWQWQPPAGLSCSNCAQPTIAARQTTRYEEKVFNQYGCSASDFVTVQVLCTADKSLFIPNTFSPNGDGVNDYFYPRGAGLYNIKSMRIFNRWGQAVFERINFPPNDISSAWDGTINGKPQPSDVYVYMIEVICTNGTVLTTKGDITLLR